MLSAMVSPRGLTPRRGRGERGVALMMVLLLVALMSAVAAEFQFNSHIDYRLAINARDALQAEYNALSAMRVRALLLRQSGKLNSARSAIASAVGMDVNAIPSIGQVLEMMPVECGLLSAILTPVGGGDGFSDQSDSGDDSMEATGGLLPEECLATSVSEHSKIPLNALRDKTNKKSERAASLLLGLLSGPQMIRHFENDDRLGGHLESAPELVSAIIDWVDDNDTQELSSISDEGVPYHYLEDRYEVKNAPFDSLAELQLVAGVDDELFELLRGHTTIYAADVQLELETAPIERIVLWGLTAALHPDLSAEMLFSHPGFVPFLVSLIEMKQFGAGGFGALTTSTLGGLVKEFGLDQIIDINALTRVFGNNSSTTWYTINAVGTVGDASREIEVVFQAAEGQLYYAAVR